MIGPILGSVAATAIATAAVAGHGLGGAARPVVSPFGGSALVHLAQVGEIDVDLQPSGATRLRRVGCAGASSTTTACFVTRP